MFQPLHNFFHKELLPWDESDLKYAVQSWLREQTGSDQILCQSVQKGQIAIRVISPALRQEVGVLEYDLRKMLQDKYQYELTSVVVTQR